MLFFQPPKELIFYPSRFDLLIVWNSVMYSGLNGFVAIVGAVVPLFFFHRCRRTLDWSWFIAFFISLKLLRILIARSLHPDLGLMAVLCPISDELLCFWVVVLSFYLFPVDYFGLFCFAIGYQLLLAWSKCGTVIKTCKQLCSCLVR